MLGWAGHTRQGSAISNVTDIWDRVFHNTHRVFKDINLKYDGRRSKRIKYKKVKFAKLLRPNHPNNCFTVDIAQLDSRLLQRGFNQIQFNFFDDAELDVELKMEDRAQSVLRSFKYNKFRNSGQVMRLDLTENLYRYFAVELEQNIFGESDPKKRCKNYENQAYEDCDFDFIKSVLRNHNYIDVIVCYYDRTTFLIIDVYVMSHSRYPAGFTPVWATANISAATPLLVTDGKHDELYADIITDHSHLQRRLDPALLCRVDITILLAEVCNAL